MRTAVDLNEQFNVPMFGQGRNGMTRALLEVSGRQVEVYPHGAHVTRFEKVAEPPILFLSKASLFQPGKAIRGGVPVIFPWFGPRQDDPTGKSPMHGFARTIEWTVESVRATTNLQSVSLALHSDDATRAQWPFEFKLTYTVTLDADRLRMELAVTNHDRKPFKFEEALHTYFAVSDVRNVTVEGLADTAYIDKVDRFARKRQDLAPIRITGETDRIYLDTRAACTIRDPGHHRRIVVEKENSDSTVLWNPWIAKSKAMADFGDDEWPNMLCIETCNVNANAVTLAPGASHVMRATIRTEPGPTI
ncbi:MAG TPA: D-hexose-6-phosphate mutarotase [Tepidisphaeraceae bacterium]|jgi:D-hexose-6-phosphate mutarotase